MRLKLILLAGLVAMPTVTSAQTPDAAYVAFDKNIAQTKQAMMSDPAKALTLAERGVAIASRMPPSRRSKIAAATAAWLHGEALIFVNRPSDAQRIIDQALTLVERIDPASKLQGDLLRSRGALKAAEGHVLEALRDYQRAHDVFQAAGVRRSQAMALQDIGILYLEANDYPRVLKYYEQSAEVFVDDTTLTMTMHNNRAEVYRKQQNYPAALSAYRSALREARVAKSLMLQTRILTNLAASEADAGHLDSAQEAINQATALSGHGEAAGWQPFVYGVAAKIAFKRGDASRAAQLLSRTFAGVDLSRSEMSFRDYHETAANVHERLGEDRQAFIHLKAFQRLDKEAQATTASAASQLIAARFDFANQDLKISKLKEGQLARDVQLERQKNEARAILLSGLLAAGAVVVSLLLFGFFSIRRSRNKVREANNSLSTMNEALETALRAKTEFLATTSHEIRTPLNGILGMTQVLLQDRSVRSDIRERIEVVHGAGETMRALVDDILDVAKMETGLLTVVREPVDLQAVLADASKLWTGQAQTKGVDMVVAIDAAPKRMMSDAGRLRQIAFNLMSNALKFTATGAVTLSATAEGSADVGEQVVIRVSDTGIGIPADKLDTIFEPFRQVDGGITRQYGGTGLGLAIVRNLVQALGGTITVESVLGRGTTFVVRLPLERIVSEATSEQTLTAHALADASLLIVERDPAKLGMLRLLLAAEVRQTAVVPDGIAAARAVADGGITHVLADADALFDGNGHGADDHDHDHDGAASALVRAAHDAGVHLTLLATPQRQARLLAAGASHIVAKPISAVGLIAALEEFYRSPDDAIVAHSDAKLAA